ncbi:hypothetical protein DPX16_14088 [Anabarilius grahami]|uniref:Uncharacterized protein n=1 Tax=Anabarilius grahami TaxID=495550 RepID=A0A3N0Y9S1_ANAGA|nr:hypothetical protein DPX16_14088 [Anabarilius grahami]
MALFYTRCLQDLPRLTINDVDRLVKKSCPTPSSKREKGFKMYIASYIDNYEGCALCNHLVALLYQTAHYSQLNIPAVPPVHSCTDTEQIWHKPRTLGVRPGPVGEMEFRKPSNSTTDCVRSSLYKALDGELPDFAMLRVSEVYKDFPPSLAPLLQARTTILCLCSIRAGTSAPEVSGGVIQHGPQDRSCNTRAEFMPGVASFEKDESDIYSLPRAKLAPQRQTQIHQARLRCIGFPQSDRRMTSKLRENDPKAEGVVALKMLPRIRGNRRISPRCSNASRISLLSTIADVSLLLMLMALRTYIGIQTWLAVII